MFATGRIQAPNNPVLRRELILLERRNRPSGKDLVTHPPSSHDDLANAACGAMINAYRVKEIDWSVFAEAVEHIANAKPYDIAGGCLTDHWDYCE